MTGQAVGSPGKVSIIVPAYNERDSIGPLVEKLIALDLEKEIIVVDDGSTDGTAGILAERPGIRVVSHPYNKGNGAAVKTGLAEARREWVVIIDGDGQHDPDDIPRLVAELGKHHLVIGARPPQDEAGRMRLLGNRVLSRLAGLLTGFPVQDLTCGLRAIHRPSALMFRGLYPDGFSFPTTSIMCFLMTGLNVRYLPIRAAARRAGSQSKIRLWRDGLRFAVMILRIVMFNPLKVFLPIGLILLALGGLWTLKTLYSAHAVSAGGVLLLTTGLNFTFFGFVLDQIIALRKDLLFSRNDDQSPNRSDH